MDKKIIQQLTPHLVAILIFLILSFGFLPSLLEGKQLIAHDTESWRSMAQETISYNETNDDITLWTNSMFGGMPNYQISMKQPNNVLKYLESAIMAIPHPAYNLLLYLTCFYVMMLMFGARPWVALVGALGFTFASYNFIIIAAGHNSKAITIAYMAPLIGAVFLTLRRRIWVGGVLTALFLSLAIRANHIQILYYTLFILLIFAIVELIYAIRQKTIAHFLKSSGVLLLALLLGLGMNATSLLTTYEYGQYTMRGKSNGLTIDEGSSQQGLNKDYITQWSYGVGETFTLLIPNFNGGASSGELNEEGATAQKMSSLGVPKGQIKQFLQQMPTYWGTQPFTSGPVYLGAIVIFLFVLSFFIVERRYLWWLVPTILLTMLLSWGRNFMPLTDFFIDYVPLYNKFRTVSMILVSTGFAITLLAFLSLVNILKGDVPNEKMIRSVLISGGIVGGLSLIFALIPSLAGNFVSPTDAQFQGDYAFLRTTLPLDREALLRTDALRSFLFVAVAVGLLWLFLKKKINENVMLILLGIVLLLDLAPIAKRYLNENNFEKPRHTKHRVVQSPADKFILQDKSYYRVLDMSTNIFNDATPAYYHKDIGGYHAAKLRRYQELINMQLDGEIREITDAFSTSSLDSINMVLRQIDVLNMLNMKYLIYNKDAQPIINPYHNGNAWFVNDVLVAQSADEEMAQLGNIDTRTTLVVDRQTVGELPQGKLTDRDTTATIALQSYAPNRLVYSYDSKTAQVVVFSEIFYDKGWVATANDKPLPIYRVNYLLRGLSLPSGKYEITFRFDPPSYRIGNLIALIASILMVLAVVWIVYNRFKKRKKA